MRKTYIFFEPNDVDFFEKIVCIYGGIIKEYYDDAEKAYQKEQSYNALIFPACGYNNKLSCLSKECCPNECSVLNEDQKDRITVTLKDAIYKLRTINNVNNIIVDKIYQNSFFLLSTKTEPLSYRQNHTLSFYLQLMRKISGKTDVERLVYVCPVNSNYDYFRDEMTKSTSKTLDECAYYR